ncbi:MAG TPA: acyl-CoA thioesterase domain-containing protein [Actinomycetaceae bacterium]|nr:acyl-CoA thioesterase domain-containing protein [Actinomycetaceae bacterium]
MTSRSKELQDVLDVLELRREGPLTFTATSLERRTGRVFGGQVLAQALLAAGATLPADAGTAPRLPHSVHGYFLRPGRVEVPIVLEVEELRDGGSFSARRTHALQNDVPILSMITSFQEQQEGLEHAEEPPTVPGPEDLRSAREVISGVDHPAARFMLRHGAFDLRHVEGHLYLPETLPPAATRHCLWMRSRGGVPDDQLLHRALLAYACDQVMLEPILRALGISWLSEGLNMASLDHAMWWHRDVRVDEWLLYVLDSPSAQGGRGLGTARVFDERGRLVATIAQEGMVRMAPAQ